MSSGKVSSDDNVKKNHVFDGIQQAYRMSAIMNFCQ